MVWFRGLGFKAFGELGLGFKDLRLGIVLGLRAFGVKQLRFGWLSKLWSLFGSLTKSTAPIISGTQKGAIILTITHLRVRTALRICGIGPRNLRSDS